MFPIFQVQASSSKVSPFLWDGAFTSAKFLLLLPLEHLSSLAEEAGDPTTEERTVTIIHMTIRCGSTILGQVSKRSQIQFFSQYQCSVQVLEALPETRLLSEPMVLGYACSKYTKGILSKPETLQLVDCFFRLLCKKERNVKHVVLKVIPLTTPALSFLKEKYPKIKLVFNTRHPRSTTISFRKLENRLLTFSTALSGIWNLARWGKA